MGSSALALAFGMPITTEGAGLYCRFICITTTLSFLLQEIGLDCGMRLLLTLSGMDSRRDFESHRSPVHFSNLRVLGHLLESFYKAELSISAIII
jgi:hypothetical protein